MDGQTDGPTDTVTYRVVCTQLKSHINATRKCGIPHGIPQEIPRGVGALTTFIKL